MKIFITIFFLFLSFTVIADTYYCVADKSIGFERSQGMKATKFIPEKFIIEIDYELQKIKEDEDDDYWGFISVISQSCVIYEGIINCINDLGSSFVFSKQTKVYYASSLYLRNTALTDDIWMSYGSCSKF